MAALNLLQGGAVSGQPIKCGTWAHLIIRESWDALPAPAKELYSRRYLAKPAQAQAERLFLWPPSSPRFFIHYQDAGPGGVPDSDAVTLTDSGFRPGANNVRDYVEWAAFAFDTVYHYLVDSLGYGYPFLRVGARMLDLGNYYGYAYSRDSIELDNDMAFLAAKGSDVRDGIFVTVAHEFYHMVQFCYTMDFNFFHEASATWMEDKMFPRVDDYLQYLDTIKNPFNIIARPGFPLDDCDRFQPDNYDRVVWPMFLDQRYSPAVIRRAWEGYRAGDTLTSRVFGSALESFQPGLRFQAAFAEFGRWLYYTGPRSDYCSTFTDAPLWPSVHTETADLGAFVFRDAFSLERLSLNYWRFADRDRASPGLWMASADSHAVFGAIADTALRTLLSESLYISTDPLAVLPFTGPVAGEEAFGLFNPNEVAENGSFFLFDSEVIDTAGTILPFSPYPGFRTEIAVLDTLRIALKDSAGQSIPAGIALHQILHGKGVFIEPDRTLLGKPPALEKARARRVFSIGVHPWIDSLMDLGKAALAVIRTDSSDYFVNDRTRAFHPQSGDSLPVTREAGGFRMEYGDFRALLPACRMGADSALCRIFYAAVLRANTDFAAFPVPAYSDDERLFFTCHAFQESRSECRLYTLSGALVRVLSAARPGETAAVSNTDDRIIFSWDFRNAAGKRIAPGVYLYHIRVKEGYLPVTGKVAVLGRRRG